MGSRLSLLALKVQGASVRILPASCPHSSCSVRVWCAGTDKPANLCNLL